MAEPFLQLQNLKTHFPVEQGVIFKKQTGTIKAVDGVDLELRQGEILGLVGESGCGKSTLGRTILQLIPATAGVVYLEGTNLTALSGEALRNARADFQMIFQDPYASLNPRMTVYDTLAEAIQSHRKVPSRELMGQVSELMSTVGLSPRYLKKYPHEFSGGQRQRIAIARALAVKPKLIVADEPVSALDVSIQAQIINLLAKLSREMGLTLIFISHDLSVVKHISDRIAVMYLGKIVEIGAAAAVFEKPLHPYTKALVSAVPMPDPVLEKKRQRILLPGDPPSPLNPPGGCPFHPRCPWRIEACAKVVPQFESLDGEQKAACIRLKEINKNSLMNYKIQRQLTVALENQPGRLAAICRKLAEHNINIKDLAVLDNIEQGVIRLVTSDPALTRELLVKEGHYVVEADVLMVDLRDAPGQLARLSDALAKAGVNIDYAYGSEDPAEEKMRVILKASPLDRAGEVLSTFPEI